MLCAADFRTYKMVICLLHYIIDMDDFVVIKMEPMCMMELTSLLVASRMKQIEHKHWEILAVAANTT